MTTSKTSKVRSVAIDGSIVLGLGLLTYGSWLIYEPAAFLTSGTVLLGIGLYAAVRR